MHSSKLSHLRLSQSLQQTMETAQNLSALVLNPLHYADFGFNFLHLPLWTTLPCES